MEGPQEGRALLHNGGWLMFSANWIRGEVMLMGDGRGPKALRFAVCLVVILAVMIYISPKAC